MKARNGHRAIVVDANQKPSNVITESRLLKIASVLLDVLPITKKTLKELNIGTKNVITIEASKNTRDAFQLIKEKVKKSTILLNFFNNEMFQRKLLELQWWIHQENLLEI